MTQKFVPIKTERDTLEMRAKSLKVVVQTVRFCCPVLIKIGMCHHIRESQRLLYQI
jgi:hypothetical protein